MKDTIPFTEFSRLDIRIGTILLAENIAESTKLLRLEIDLGSEKRQLVAGLGAVVTDPSTLIGKQIPVLVNLEPRMLRGIESQGMILAADDNGSPVLLLPETKLPNGSIVR